MSCCTSLAACRQLGSFLQQHALKTALKPTQASNYAPERVCPARTAALGLIKQKTANKSSQDHTTAPVQAECMHARTHTLQESTLRVQAETGDSSDLLPGCKGMANGAR